MGAVSFRPSSAAGISGGLSSSIVRAMVMLVVLASAACTTFGEPVVSAPPGETTAFEGLAQLASDDGPTAVDILLVHGMCTHDAGWAEAAIEQVATMLGGAGRPDVERLAVPQSSADVFGSDLATPNWQARVAAIVWSPIVASTKAELCEDTTSRSPACRRDAGFSPALAGHAPGLAGASAHPLKDRLIDDCMADAVIYLGRARDQINDQMQQALVTAARHFEARRGHDTAVARPLVVITQGLGGKLAFDALLRMQQDFSLSHVGNRLADRATRIYLAANQLPFLDLGDATFQPSGAAASPPGTVGPANRRHLMRLFDAAEAASAPSIRTASPERSSREPRAASRSPGAATLNPIRVAGMPSASYAPDPIDQFIRSHATQRRQGPSPGRPLPPLQVVAFNDPHDLMAYGVNPARRADSAIIDVSLELEPAALGIVVPPDPAHLNYLRDARVRELILCGFRQAHCGLASPRQTAEEAVAEPAPLPAPRPPPSIFGPR